MLHPLALDVLECLLPLLLGGAAFACGRALMRRSRPLRIGGIVLAVVVVVVAGGSLRGMAAEAVAVLTSWVGGAAVVLAWTALFLLGVV